MTPDAVREAAERSAFEKWVAGLDNPRCPSPVVRWRDGKPFVTHSQGADESIEGLWRAFLAGTRHPSLSAHAPAAAAESDGSPSRDAMIVEAVRLRSGDTEAEALRALLAMFPPATPSSPPVEAVVWGVRDDQGEWWFSDPFTEEEARAEAWRLTGSLTRKHEAVPLYTTPPPSPAPAPSGVEVWRPGPPTVAGYYLCIDANDFELFRKYPTVASHPMHRASQYEVAIGARGPVAISYRGGTRSEFLISEAFDGGAAWFGPIPAPQESAAAGKGGGA